MITPNKSFRLGIERLILNNFIFYETTFINRK